VKHYLPILLARNIRTLTWCSGASNDEGVLHNKEFITVLWHSLFCF
jgi:hypothetical protein